jgi:hypothetical protein
MPAAEWSEKSSQKHQDDVLLPLKLPEIKNISGHFWEGKVRGFFADTDKSRFYWHTFVNTL